MSTLQPYQTNPDIDVKHAPIPPVNQPTIFSSPFMTIYADGQALVRVEGTVSILVSAGQHVTIEATAKATQGEIMTFLLGPALGLLCHQRQVLPLHAASIKIGNTAVALVGQSGAGKSTSAAALISRGHQLLCDDITVVDAAHATVRPSYPAVKLWQDAADALAIQTGPLSRTRADLKKFHYPAAPNFNNSSVGLGAIILLYPRTHVAAAELAPLNKIHALAQLSQHIYRRRLSNLIGSEQACFNQLGQLISKVPVMALVRPDGFANLDSTLDIIEQAVSP